MELAVRELNDSEPESDIEVGHVVSSILNKPCVNNFRQLTRRGIQYSASASPLAKEDTVAPVRQPVFCATNNAGAVQSESLVKIK